MRAEKPPFSSVQVRQVRLPQATEFPKSALPCEQKISLRRILPWQQQPARPLAACTITRSLTSSRSAKYRRPGFISSNSSNSSSSRGSGSSSRPPLGACVATRRRRSAYRPEPGGVSAAAEDAAAARVATSRSLRRRRDARRVPHPAQSQARAQRHRRLLPAAGRRPRGAQEENRFVYPRSARQARLPQATEILRPGGLA